MKRFILTVFLLITSSVFAGPFVSINSVRAGHEDDNVDIEVSVIGTDSGEVHGLDEDNLQVYEDGYRVNYVKVKKASGDMDGLYFVFAMDSSRSISRALLESIKKNADSIMRGVSTNDRIAFYRFNGDIKLLNSFTSDRKEIAKSIQSIRREGAKTRLYDAIYDSTELLGRIKSRRRAVIVFTDGTDDGSSINENDVVARSRETGVPVYFVSYRSASGSAKMRRIAKLTGGRVFNVSAGNCQNIYGIILSSIKSVYHINYRSQAKNRGDSHNLEVRLRHGSLKDRDSTDFRFENSMGGISINRLLPGMRIFIAVFSALLFVFLMVYISRLIKNRSRESKKTGLDFNNEGDDSSYVQVSAGNYVSEEPFSEYDEDYPREVPDVMYSEAWLQRKGDGHLSKKIPLLKRDAVIGYGRDNLVQVDDEKASLQHARIRRIEGGYYLYDLISDRGTYLNGRKLLRPRLLHDWDEIRVGGTVFIFRGIR